MKILNPLYDAAFKFLMEDQKVAKLMLSTLLGKEVLELQITPTEVTTDVNPDAQPKKKKKQKESPDEQNKTAPTFTQATGITVYQIDFSARVREADGTERQILIELQKARLLSDLVRFRKYLGEHFKNPSLFVELTSPGSITKKVGIPIYAIYLLGYIPDERYANIPVLRIGTNVTDHHSGQELEKNTPFIRTLFHEGLIVNIPALSERRRNRLEQMLSVFEGAGQPRQFFLEMDEEKYPEEFAPIIRRLMRATLEEKVRNAVEVEEQMIEDFMFIQAEMEREKAEKEREKAEKEREKAEKERERAEKEQAQAEKEQAQAERRIAEMVKAQAEAAKERAEAERQIAEIAKAQAEAAKERAEAERHEAERQRLQALQIAARVLAGQGFLAEAIAAQLTVSLEQVQRWIDEQAGQDSV